MAPPPPIGRPSGDRSGDSSVESAALAQLAQDFPALAYTLGARRFGQISAEALSESATRGCSPGETVERVVVHRLMHRLMRLRTRKAGSAPSRLAADLAAAEWAYSSVLAQPPSASLPLRRDQLPDGDALANTVLVAIAALRIVPVAFALQAYLRRVHEDRRPSAPRRADDTLVIARPHFEPFIETLTRGEGRLLSLLILGAPIGNASATAVAQGWVDEPATAHACLQTWVAKGFFAEARRAEN